MYSIAATRDSDDDSPVRYKIRLKRYVQDILKRNKYIYQIYYEEPVIAFASSVKNLFMLRSFVEEIIIENEPDFDYIKHYEVPNMRWKKEFLAPDKIPQGTDNQKKAVRTKLESMLPFLRSVTQDEIDAICQGYVAVKYLKDDNGGEALQSKKKPRPFQYNIAFIGSDEDDGMLTDLLDVYSGPKRLLENGINFSEIDRKTNFDKHVYEKMGEDDKLLIIKFSSDHHDNLVLKYKIGNLAAQYNYIYALIWRKSRK
jgi:hypothetical protein